MIGKDEHFFDCVPYKLSPTLPQMRFFIRPPGKAWIEIDQLRYLQY